jgi:hypothetical protein
MSLTHIYSGNAYEHDNVDSRADLSKAASRTAVAERVLRAKRPFSMDERRWNELSEWANQQINGCDSLPPMAVTAIVACRWPGEPVQNNGVRSESNAK